MRKASLKSGRVRGIFGHLPVNSATGGHAGLPPQHQRGQLKSGRPPLRPRRQHGTGQKDSTWRSTFG